MKYNKKLLLLLFLLNSCVETTAFLGPAVTAGSTGNIYQAGLNYGMNKTVLSTTGKYPIEHLTNILNKTKETVELAKKYKKEGMSAYSRIQQQEFAREKDGYTSVKHQREVGTSYFDAVSNTISSGKSSTTAMDGSTESEQF